MTTWEQVMAKRPWGSWPDVELVRSVKRDPVMQRLKVPPLVLEVGIGGGANLRFFADEAMWIAGIDIAPSAVESALDRLSRWYPHWQERAVPSSSGEALVVGHAADLPWPDNTFDFVVDCGCICCLDFGEARSAYREALRVAKPGARLFIRTFADGVTGGIPVGKGMYAFDNGPLAPIPPTRMSSLDEMREVTEGWSIDDARLVLTTQVPEEQVIAEWVLSLRKPQR